MPANVDGMVREGINAYRAGRKEEARTLLLRAVEIDQYNEQAWLWLSAVVESTDEQRTCLENVLTINPNNERAKQGLAMMSQKSAAPPKPAARQEKPAFDDSFPAAASSAAPKASPTAEEDELPATIWGDAPVTASSSASSNYRVNEPSSQEYDDWVSNLGLGGQTPAQKQIDPSQFSFGMDEEDDDDEVADLNDLRSTLAQMDEESPFGPFGMTDTPAQPMPAARASSKPSAPPPTRQPERQTHDALLDAIEDDEADDLEFGGEDEDEFGDDSIGKLDASEFFQYIPKEITATRMPGTRERAPLLPLLGVLLFLAANIGAVIFFISRMTGAA